MPKTIDFEKLRRRRRVTLTVKRLLALCLITGIVGAIIFINSLFVEQGFAVRISEFVGSFGGQGFPAELPGGIIRDVRAMGSSLAVLNDTNLYVYNRRGRIIVNSQEMTDNTSLCTSPEKALAFDVGSKRYKLITPASKYDVETENSILAADVGESGEYALVTSSRQFVAEVTVFETHLKPYLFRWSSTDNHVTHVSLAPKGGMMAVACVAAEGGMLKSIINLFEFNKDDKIAEVEFPDSMVLSLDFYEQGRIGVLTDREYAVLDSSGKKLSSCSLADKPVASFETWGKEALFLAEYKETRSSEIILIGEDGNERARLEAGDSIRGIAIGPKKLYVLDETGISIYNRDFVLEDKLEMRAITRIRFITDRLYYFTAEEICVL